MKSLVWIVLVLLSPLVMSRPANAQQLPPLARDTVTRDTLRGPTPRLAFVRSLLVPGWGQFSVGSYGRGALFAGIQGTSVYMLLKTLSRLEQARDRETEWVGFATDSLNLLMEQDTIERKRLLAPGAFGTAVDENPGVSAARALVGSRERHRQDWITYLLFFTMMSGVDAYVTAHLRDFPAELSVQPRKEGGVVVGASVPVGGPR